MTPSNSAPPFSELEPELIGSDFLRLLTDRLPVRVAYIDREFRFRFMNDAYEKVSGISREHAIGLTIAEALSEAVFASVRDNLERGLGGETHTQEFDVPYDPGTRRVQVAYVPDVDSLGKVRGVVVQAIDVTEQRQAEAALRKSEERYRTLFNSLEDGFCVIQMIFDEQGGAVDYRFKETNAAFEGHTGITAADVAAGRTMREIAPDHEDYWFEVYGRVATTGVPVRLENAAAALDRWYEVYAFRIGGDDGPEVGVLFKDVSERRRNEIALSVERDRLQTLFRLSPTAIALLAGEELRFVYANQAMCAFVGRADVIGKPLEVALPEMSSQGFPQLLRQVLATGEPAVFAEVPVVLRSGPNGEEQTRYVNQLYQPILGADGMNSGVFAHVVDVTDQVTSREAIRRMNEELEETVARRTEDLVFRNQELERFTYAVSHDMRTPLRAIVANAKIVLLDEGDRVSEEGFSRLERLSLAALRMASLVDDLLEHARLGKVGLTKEPVPIAELARRVVEEVASEPHGGPVSIEIGDEVLVQADPRILGMALQNLFDNACKYVRAGATPEVRFGMRYEKGEPVFFVRDNGIGFEMVYVEKLFAPFERLHREEYAGTGIGLANVKRAIERHGGRIWAESEGLGTGATFYFTLGPDAETR